MKNPQLGWGIFICSKWSGRRDSPTENAFGSDLAVFAFRGIRSNKNIAPAFSSRRRQSCLPALKIKEKKTRICEVYCAKRRGSGIRLPVKFLTEFSCRPGSRYSPLPSGKTRTSLRLSIPDATPSSGCCFHAHFYKTKTALRRFLF